CQDHHHDGLESDVDCGGGICAGCALGQNCQVNSDCASKACDATTLHCVGSQCADHKQDGAETDVDCGGGGGGACDVGMKGLVNFDCHSGHVCSATLHVCQ